MGSDASKSNNSDEEEFKKLISKVFNVTNLKDIGLIDKKKLEKVWNTFLDAELITIYSTYIERKVTSRKKYDDKMVFHSLFRILVKGNNTEKAELMACLFNLKSKVGTPEGQDSFLIEEQVKYMNLLFTSFYKSLETENDDVFIAWSKAGVGFDKTIKKNVISFIMKDLQSDNSLVSIENLENWLIRWPLFSTLQNDVLKKAFGYHDKIGVHQQQLPTPDFGAIGKTRLDIHHVIYLTNCLLPELRHKWRLLYSSRFSGESWIIFLKSVLEQGPTLLFIWDKNNNCFGGFASSSWSLSPQFYGDDNCFLFTLLPNLDKFDPTNFNKNFQYINTAQATFPNGLGMGGQLDYWGIYIDSSMKFGKVSVSCSTFANYKPPTDATFDIEDIEVWGLGEKPVSLEPETRQRSVLDSQTDAKAVLEMMGKRQVSEGLREPIDDD